MTCEEVRLALGAQALGALEPDEAEEVDTHLATCEECGAELLELEGVAAFLGKVSERDVALVASPPRRVLDRLLNDRARRHRRGRRLLAVGATAAALVVGGVVGGTVWTAAQRADQGEPAAAPQRTSTSADLTGEDGAAESRTRFEEPSREMLRPKASASSPGLLMTPEGGDFAGESAGRAATVTAAPDGDRTRLLVRVAGVPVGTTCRLLVVGADGTRERTRPWTISRETYEDDAAFPRVTRIPLTSITRFDLIDETGEVLVTVPVRR